MGSKPADSVRLEVESSPPDKSGNEARLTEQAVEFFGHDRLTNAGFRHQFASDPTGGPERLFTSVIFYDETPYED